MATFSAPSSLQTRCPAPAGEPDGDQSFDTPRAFLGPNASYYDERWRWMDWTDRRSSWNWSAALGFGAWLAYRRMYGPAAVAVAWQILGVALALASFPVAILAVVQGAIAASLGFYGNTMYLRHFHRRAGAVLARHRGAAARERALARAGGTSPLAALAAVLIVLLALLALLAGHAGEVRLRWL